MHFIWGLPRVVDTHLDGNRQNVHRVRTASVSTITTIKSSARKGLTRAAAAEAYVSVHESTISRTSYDICSYGSWLKAMWISYKPNERCVRNVMFWSPEVNPAEIQSKDLTGVRAREA